MIKPMVCTLLSLLSLSSFGNASVDSIVLANTDNPAFNSTLANNPFTGEVWLDPIYSDNATTMADVFFTPSARTFWHRHVGGQLLSVVAGTGWVADQGGKPRAIHKGDVVWCPPGVVHWHGADEGSFMLHFAASYGPTEWLGEVSDEERV